MKTDEILYDKKLKPELQAFIASMTAVWTKKNRSRCSLRPSTNVKCKDAKENYG